MTTEGSSSLLSTRSGVRFPRWAHVFVRVRKWFPMDRIIYPVNLDYSEVNLIINDWTFEIPIVKFGTHRSCQIAKIWNLLNSPVHPELNSRGIGRIRKLIIVSQLAVFGVPRLPSVVFYVHFESFLVIIRTFLQIKIRRTTILAFLACYKLTLFLLLRIWVSLWCFFLIFKLKKNNNSFAKKSKLYFRAQSGKG